MEDLNKELKDKIDGFDMQNDNLEIELGKEQYQDKMPEIKKIIWEKVNQADISVLEKIISKNTNNFKGIKTMISKFTDAHPQVLNIITTNYDRVLEHVMSYNDISFTDGFNGKTLSIFDDTQFKDNKIFAFDSSKLSIFSLICAFKSSILGNPKGIVAPEPQTIKGGSFKKV
jgi:hypothetical protein